MLDFDQTQEESTTNLIEEQFPSKFIEKSLEGNALNLSYIKSFGNSSSKSKYSTMIPSKSR